MIDRFGQMPDGRGVERITLRGGGLTLALLTHGARVQTLMREGVAHPLVLGADSLAPYLTDMAYFGAIVGRYANRIAQGRFALDDRTHQCDRNYRDRHTLHGGRLGADAQIWRILRAGPGSACLALDLPDGQMGFPGNLAVTADFALPGDGCLAITIRAETDAATPCSFAHHSYFALGGGGDVTADRLWIDAAQYLPVDADLIPDGPPAPVAGTAFDFRQPRVIGDHGYDHNFCLSDRAQEPRLVARLECPRSGLGLEVVTDQPGLQVYDGAHITAAPGLGGRPYGPKSGLALEPQAWPDAPNRPDFPAAILRPGAVYRQQTRFRVIDL